jgi:hypothetical protein
MPPRPNPFLERKIRLSQISAAPQSSWFQRARDWTTFVVSLTSLVTALIALGNTLTGPRPLFANLNGDSITLLRSDEYLVGSPPKLGLPLRDENGIKVNFPLILVQITLANRGAPPNGIGVRAIEGRLVLLQDVQNFFDSKYNWYQLTKSSATRNNETDIDTLVFDSTDQVAPFDLSGGNSWSREVLLIPEVTWAGLGWTTLAEKIDQSCKTPKPCRGQLILNVRFDNDLLLQQTCTFSIDEHFLAHFRGVERRYFTTPRCLSSEDLKALRANPSPKTRTAPTTPASASAPAAAPP